MNRSGVAVALFLLASACSSTSQKTSTVTTETSDSAVKTPRSGTLHVVPEVVALESGGSVTVERGVLFVSANRAAQSEEILSIEFYRFRATGDVPADRPPIFMLMGGPGFPGLGDHLSKPGTYEGLVAPLTKVADLVVIGQRGIGSSKPDTRCDSMGEQPTDRHFPLAEYGERIGKAMVACRDAWIARGLDLGGINVLEAAGDVDDVRKALGYRQITIRGSSFGSHWAMAVMRLYPDTVARALLSGLEGPDHTYDSPTGVLAALSRIAQAAEKAPELTKHLPEGGFIEAFKRLIARADKEPISVKLTVNDEKRTVWLGANEIRELAYGVNARTGSRQGIASWPADMIAMHRGDFKPAALALIRSRDGGLPRASFFLLDCGSGITAARREKYRNDPATAVLGDINWFYDVSCPSWNADLGDEFRLGFDSDIPTVLVQGDWDTSTPIENTFELVPRFRNSKLVTIRGGSHGAPREARKADPAFSAALDRFLATGEMSGLPEQVVLPPLEWKVPANGGGDK